MTDLVALVLGVVVVGGSLVFAWRAGRGSRTEAEGHETSEKG